LARRTISSLLAMSCTNCSSTLSISVKLVPSLSFSFWISLISFSFSSSRGSLCRRSYRIILRPLLQAQCTFIMTFGGDSIAIILRYRGSVFAHQHPSVAYESCLSVGIELMKFSSNLNNMCKNEYRRIKLCKCTLEIHLVLFLCKSIVAVNGWINERV
jgi:hypothetical protein